MKTAVAEKPLDFLRKGPNSRRIIGNLFLICLLFQFFLVSRFSPLYYLLEILIMASCGLVLTAAGQRRSLIMTEEMPGKSQAKRRDPFSRIFGGLVLILLGALFLLANLHRILWEEWWAYFVLGLGCIFLLETLVRALADRANPWPRGKLIAGAVLFAVGAGYLYGLVTWWPVVLIAIGLAVILSSLGRTS
jgi:hypothetical protein